MIVGMQESRTIGQRYVAPKCVVYDATHNDVPYVVLRQATVEEYRNEMLEDPMVDSSKVDLIISCEQSLGFTHYYEISID